VKITNFKVFVLTVAFVIVASLIGINTLKSPSPSMKGTIEVHSLVDSTNNLEIETLLEKGSSLSWSSLSHVISDLNFGYSNDTHWIKINLLDIPKTFVS